MTTTRSWTSALDCGGRTPATAPSIECAPHPVRAAKATRPFSGFIRVRCASAILAGRQSVSVSPGFRRTLGHAAQIDGRLTRCGHGAPSMRDASRIRIGAAARGTEAIERIKTSRRHGRRAHTLRPLGQPVAVRRGMQVWPWVWARPYTQRCQAQPARAAAQAGQRRCYGYAVVVQYCAAVLRFPSLRAAPDV